ncbi:LOW QUALITY PROTEIN: L-2,4-diaminobutyrate decarboxylase [Paramyrothecium foliicola]|nr:LOW QUALITY PROTEIN: L-2,4-diaminobutyrate decarboxylase [Paramyrothecium foliicola]
MEHPPFPARCGARQKGRALVPIKTAIYTFRQYTFTQAVPTDIITTWILTMFSHAISGENVLFSLPPPASTMGDLYNIEAQRARFAQRTAQGPSEHQTLPGESSLRHAEASLPTPGSPAYLAGHTAEETARHIVGDIVPALSGQAVSPNYYGFVTGGVLPIAEWADNVVSRVDQNVQVHLPAQTVSTTVEDAALRMLAALLRLGDRGDEWAGRTFTTGATASNVLGLACGREYAVGKKLGAAGGTAASVGEVGLLRACLEAGVTDIQVLTSAGHSSLSKAASVVGLGRGSVRELRRSDDEPWRLDIDAVERELQRPGTASIIAISAGEVNTGRHSLNDMDEWKRVRELADRYGAWIHVDGAFGIFARVLDDRDEYKLLHKRVEGVLLADSITVDGHKLLNVPYDCGVFFTRSATILQSVFTNPNAAYLSSGSQSSIPSPLNIGLENSRRFRALPAYAVLHSEGRPGMQNLMSNMAQLSRRIAAFLRDSMHYELLPDEGMDLEDVFMIVLFKAKNPALNETLVERINGTKLLYVSGTKWRGESAVRIAVSNWQADVKRDFKLVSSILSDLGTASADSAP